MMNIDTAIKALRDMIAAYNTLRLDEANEAETRKLVIDKVLECVLGWVPGSDISYEERVHEDNKTTFADYILRTATTALIIEAKREGKAFDVPTDHKTAKLGGVLASGDVGEAIRQVRDYARKKAIPFAAVTNGSVWIVFPAVRTDGISFDDTQAHIFTSLGDIEKRFVKFWELMSRQRVVEGGLESCLFGVQPQVPERRLITVFREPGYRLGRNCVYEHVEPAISMALTDEAILNDIEGLQFCYVRSTERIKYDSRLQMHLADIKPALERTVVRPRRKHAEHLDELIKTSVSRMPQFILLLGPVGAGKTTFLQYTRKVSAEREINGKVLWLYVDFKKATESDEPRSFIYRELLRLVDRDTEFGLGDWDKSIAPAYEPVIANLRRGALAPLARADEKAFLIEVSRRVEKERDQVIPFIDTVLSKAACDFPGYLVVDNVDQIENSDYQRRVFLETQVVARTLGLNAIMSLRDATYLRHRHSPVFDAFQMDSIYIDPPLVAPVLSRRFSYAKTFLEGRKATIVPESGLTFVVQNLGAFFDIVAQSLLSEEAGYILEALAGGDIRRGLAMVREFLASGHTSADQVLSTYMTGAESRFFPHEILKGILLGQRQYYSEADSLILNLFDAKVGLPDAQLLRLTTLCRLVGCAAHESFAGMSTGEIVRDLYQVGISEARVLKMLQDLADNRMIATTDRSPLSTESLLQPTRLGGFAVKELAPSFVYYENCMIDAEVQSDRHWHQMCELTKEVDSRRRLARIESRLRRAEVFLDYLCEVERHWIVSCNRFRLEREWNAPVIGNGFQHRLRKELAMVLERAQRKYEREDRKRANQETNGTAFRRP